MGVVNTNNTHELSEIDAAVIAMKEENPRLSLGEIAIRLDTNKMKVARVLERNNYSD